MGTIQIDLSSPRPRPDLPPFVQTIVRAAGPYAYQARDGYAFPFEPGDLELSGST
jgi:hypothetical protein